MPALTLDIIIPYTQQYQASKAYSLLSSKSIEVQTSTRFPHNTIKNKSSIISRITISLSKKKKSNNHTRLRQTPNT